MLKHAVIPLSLKESEHKVLSMVRLLQSFGTHQVSLVHVQAGNNESTTRESKVHRIREYALKIREVGFEVQMYFKQGHVASEVISMAKELGADYISLPWERKWAIRRALLGSVDADVVRMSDLPIFVYKHVFFAIHKKNLSRAMYATNFAATDSRVMPYLLNTDFQVQTLYLVHVGERAPDPDTEGERRQAVQANLNRLRDECKQAFDQVETVDVVGPSGKKIVSLVWRYSIDLLIIGKCDSLGALEQIMGSTAQMVADKARCSIFIVPGVQRP